MKISYNWIKDYLKIDLDPYKVAEILTGIGLEVEGAEEWESVEGGLAGVVIGEVLTCKKHPDADKLSVTTVNIGSGEPLILSAGHRMLLQDKKFRLRLSVQLYLRAKKNLK